MLGVAALSLLSACAPGGRDLAPLPERLPTDAEITNQPALARTWARRVTATNLSARSGAEAALVRGGTRSLPILRWFLNSDEEELQDAAVEIAYRIGPEAVSLLAKALQHERTTVRRGAADILIDLAPDTASIQPVLCDALLDEDLGVARDAARALGALRERGGPSVRALTCALAHADTLVRLYAAEALASIGMNAAAAAPDLARAVRDPVPGVRWAACEALASIGPAAAIAVPQLIDALHDEFLYVRICAAGALGNLGAAAKPAEQPLRDAADDPAMQADATWALGRITSVTEFAHMPAASILRESVDPSFSASGPELSPAPPTAEPLRNPPIDWDTRTGRNIIWSVELGDETFGRPVVADGVVYVGTDNARRINAACAADCGVLMAFRATDGTFLWQDVAPRVERGLREFLLPSTTSAPFVDGDRLFYVTAECQLRCLDTHGFRDGENDGPFRQEQFQSTGDADVIWELDMCGRLGVFPHEACNSEVLRIGDLLIVCTSNGQNEGHTRVPSPRAPSLIAVDQHTGEVAWSAVGPGEHVLHGQWCSPAAMSVNGQMRVLFGGGDGWLRAYEARSGRELWRFDANPKDAQRLPRPGVFTRSAILATPIYDGERVYIALGEDPTHGDGPSLMHAILPDGLGDVTESRRVWSSADVGRVVGAPIIKDGLLYVGDLGGVLCCLEASTGALVWKHETSNSIWGCLSLAGDRLYVGNTDGEMTVLRTGRQKAVLSRLEMDAPLYARPAVVGDALYVATARQLCLIAKIP